MRKTPVLEYLFIRLHVRQIQRKAPVPESVFNKVAALQLFSAIFAKVSDQLFPKHLWTAGFKIWIYLLQTNKWLFSFSWHFIHKTYLLWEYDLLVLIFHTLLEKALTIESDKSFARWSYLPIKEIFYLEVVNSKHGDLILWFKGPVTYRYSYAMRHNDAIKARHGPCHPLTYASFKEFWQNRYNLNIFILRNLIVE